MNQTRSCENDAGSGCPLRGYLLGPSFDSEPAGRDCSSSLAMSRSVFISKRSLRGNSRERAWRTADATRVAFSEVPPNSMNVQSTDTRGRFSTSQQTCASIFSIWVSGSPPVRTDSGAGKALRSIFPCAVRGKFSSITQHEGTIYSGSRVCRYFCNSRPLIVFRAGWGTT